MQQDKKNRPKVDLLVVLGEYNEGLPKISNIDKTRIQNVKESSCQGSRQCRKIQIAATV